MGLGRWDKIAGLALPLVAADAQAWLMQLDIVGPWLVWGYAAFGILAVLGSARIWASPLNRSLVCGANIGCAAGWLFTAIEHALHSYFFVWPFAFGTLVLLPCASFSANKHRALALLRNDSGLRASFIALGALIVLAIPVAMHAAEARWIGAELNQLSGGNLRGTITALQAINRYPLRFGRFTYDVCDILVIGQGMWSSDEEFMREVGKILGPHPGDCESRDPHG